MNPLVHIEPVLADYLTPWESGIQNLPQKKEAEPEEKVWLSPEENRRRWAELVERVGNQLLKEI